MLGRVTGRLVNACNITRPESAFTTRVCWSALKEGGSRTVAWPLAFFQLAATTLGLRTLPDQQARTYHRDQIAKINAPISTGTRYLL